MKLLALTLSLLLAVPAHAGGPVIIEEPPGAGIPVAGLTPGEKIALAAGLLLLGVLVFGGGSDDCVCNRPGEGETPGEGGRCTC
jgi:hypothetical protein